MLNIFRLFLSDGVFANAKYNKRTGGVCIKVRVTMPKGTEVLLVDKVINQLKKTRETIMGQRSADAPDKDSGAV